jgi:hypothetical protein
MPAPQSFNKILLTTSNTAGNNITLQEISGQLYINDHLVITSANIGSLSDITTIESDVTTLKTDVITLQDDVTTLQNTGSSSTFANDYSVDFDGSNDYLQVPASSDFDFGTGAFTFSFWFNISNFDSYGAFFSRAGSGYRLKFQNANNIINLDPNSGPEIQVVNHSSSLLNAWHNLVVVRDVSDNTIKGYLDGGTPTSNSIGSSVTFSASGNPLLIGNHLGAFYLGGKIDEVAVWNSALSSSDITSIYNSGSPTDLSSYSPLGWWRMGDDDSGTGTTITDQGSGGNDGILTNGPTFSTSVPEVFANTYSIDFDGTNDYLSLGNTMIHNSSSGAFTWSLWLKTTPATGFEIFIGKDNLGGSSGGRSLLLDRSGDDIRFIAFTPSVQVATWTGGASSSNLGDNAWHNLIYVNEGIGGSKKIYFDGSEQTITGNTSGFLASNPTTQPLILSGTVDPTDNDFYRPYTGLMDEVAVWDSALSSSDITSVYNSGVPTDITSLSPVGWWRMGDNDSGTGTTITDQGSGGNNGILTNGPTFSNSIPS